MYKITLVVVGKELNNQKWLTVITVTDDFYFHSVLGFS